MSFTILFETPKTLKFVIKDVDLSIVNAARRIILSEIETAAFAFEAYEDNDIVFHKNTCALHNEFLGHRLSLLPLYFNEDELDNFNPPQYRFILKKKNIGSAILPVTTADFEIYDENDKKYNQAFHDRIFPANSITKDHILITKLKPNLYDATKGEEVDIECRASIGIGKTHARWNPVSKCTYNFTIDEKKVKEAQKTAVDKNKMETLDKYRYYIVNKYQEPCSFDFEIETECGIPPKSLFRRALQILVAKVESFSQNLVIDKSTSVDNFFTLTIINESHTLLNVLQCLIYNKWFHDTAPSSNVLEFIGYHQSHPLDNKMILKLKFKDESIDPKSFLVTECGRIISHINELVEQWRHL
jgi:DNA-directed RNA polymerase subunit L